MIEQASETMADLIRRYWADRSDRVTSRRLGAALRCAGRVAVEIDGVRGVWSAQRVADAEGRETRFIFHDLRHPGVAARDGEAVPVPDAGETEG